MTILLRLAAAALCSLPTLRLFAAAHPALPSDAELTKMIVGTWEPDHPSPRPAEVHRKWHLYQTYNSNGTFKNFSTEQEGGGPEQALVGFSGSWSVERGALVTKVTQSNMSSAVGQIAREKIESASHDSFALWVHGNLRPRHRVQLRSMPIPDPGEIPKLYSVQEAAKVLRYAVKPEYSREAVRERASGTGIFELQFDFETGRLQHIHIVQSTGSRVLDHDAVEGLKEWKAKPRTIRAMRIPLAARFR